MGTIVKRAGIDKLNLVSRGQRTVNSASLSQGMLTDDTVKFNISSNGKLDVRINDTIEVFGNTYRINTLPTFKKTSSTEYDYEIEAQGLMYDLLRCKFFNADGEGFKTTTNFPLIGNLEVFLVAIRNNMHRFSDLWEIGTFASTETKMLTFGDDTCLSALQKICQEFKTDFWVKTEGGKFKIHTGAFGSTLPIEFEYGKGKGLYELSRKNVNSNGVINRLYVNGGTENIPAGYRGFADALKFSDAGYIEDAVLIDEIGLREGSIDLTEIYPHRTGVVSALGSSKFKFHDSSMDFDLNEKEADGFTTKYLIAGTSAKVHFNTGNLAGYEFEIKKGGYNHTTKEFEIIQITNETGQKFPDELAEAFQMGVGDEYVLLDIVMPDTYIANAEAELLTKGTEQFNLNKSVKVSYDLNVDPEYIKNLATPISIGDYVRVKDADLGIDKVIRVQAITRDFITANSPTPNNYKITLADTYEISFASQMVLDITQVQNVMSITNLGKINLSQLGYKTTEELKNLVFDTDGYFDAENIKPFSIETNMLTVGSQSQQLSCSVVFLVNNAGNPNSIETKAGALYSQTYDKTWTISGSVLTIPDSNYRYVYAKCSKNGTSGTIYFTQTQIKFDEDVNDYYFLLGILHTVTEGVRVLSITIGTTTINGGLVRTGTISSLDGQTYFNLNTGEIKGKITFTNDSPAFQQMNDAIVIGGRNLAKNSKGFIDSNSDRVRNFILSENLVIGQKYTVKVRVKAVQSENDYFGINDINDNGNSFPLTRITPTEFGFTFTANYESTELVLSRFPMGTGSFYQFESFKIEKGTKATDWTPAPEDVNDQIATVQTYATTVNNLVSDISNDNKITPSEKQSLKQEYDIIVAEKPQVTAQAIAYNITTERTAYNTAYNNLITFVNPLIVNLNNTSDVDGVTLRSRFTSYYTSKVNLLKAITDSVDNDLSSVWDQMETMQTEINNEIADVKNNLDQLGDYVDGSFADGIISAAEAIAIEKYLNQINTEKVDLENKYNQVYNDSFLTGSAKTNLSAEWNNYVITHGNLISSINTAIADGATTAGEKADVDSKFSFYRNNLATLSTRFQEAVKAIETATVNAIQIGGKNLLLNSKKWNYGNWWSWDGGQQIVEAGIGGMLLTKTGVTIIDNKVIPNKTSENMIVGQVYTLSFEYHGTTPFQVSIGAQLYKNENPTALGKGKFTFTFTYADILNGYLYITNLLENTSVIVKNLKLEKGNRATDWTPAPEDIDAQINTAQTAANAANNLLSDIANDNKITPSEKSDTLKEYNIIQGEKSVVESQAAVVLINSQNYTDNYNALTAYLFPAILGDLSTTTDIDGVIFRGKFKSYYDAKIALLKAITDKLNNVQIGGRNLVKNSNKFYAGSASNGISPTVTAEGYLQVTSSAGNGNWHNGWFNDISGINERFSDGEVFTITFWVRRVSGTGAPSIYVKDGMGYFILNGELNATDFRPITYSGVWNKASFVNPHLGWYLADGVFQINKWQIEKGNKATDWTPAPEDIDAAVAQANQAAANAYAQANNAINTANATASVTSFLQTTIDGNVVSAGTLQVGDVNGANAMVSGVTDKPNGESIRFAAGKPYAQKYLSPFQVLDNGMVRFVNPTTGQKTFELGFNQNTGKVVFDIYNENGIKVASIGSQGIMFTGYIPESYDFQKKRKLATSSFTKSEVEAEMINYIGKQYTGLIDGKESYEIGIIPNIDTYLYNEGRNFESAGNAQYVGFYPTPNKLGEPIPNGIYVSQVRHSVIINASTDVVVYNGIAVLFNNGKETNSLNFSITKQIRNITDIVFGAGD